MLRPCGLLLFGFAALTGCATAKPAARLAPAPGPKITFIVRQACKLPLVELPGVTVTGIRRDGTRFELGRTFGGRITVAKARLQAEQIQFLLFSLPNFYAVAIDVASNATLDEPGLLEFDEYNVELPMTVVY